MHSLIYFSNYIEVKAMVKDDSGVSSDLNTIIMFIKKPSVVV